MKNRGFIALISAIIISAVLITITFTLSASSFFTRFNILSSEFKERSAALAEACGDIALLKLAQVPTYSGNETVTIGSDTCSIFPIPPATGGQITVSAKAIFQRVVTNIKIVANTADLSIISWEEMPNLP